MIEFRGTLRADGAGSAFEGSLGYAFGTKFQFVGLLLIGAVLLFAGAVRELEGAAGETGMLGMGLVVAGVAAIWIYASSRTRADQIQFIRGSPRAAAWRRNDEIRAAPGCSFPAPTKRRTRRPRARAPTC